MSEQSHDRIFQVTEQLHDKIAYLCREYNVHCAEMVGILTLLAYDLMAENSEDDD